MAVSTGQDEQLDQQKASRSIESLVYQTDMLPSSQSKGEKDSNTVDIVTSTPTPTPNSQNAESESKRASLSTPIAQVVKKQKTNFQRSSLQEVSHTMKID